MPNRIRWIAALAAATLFASQALPQSPSTVSSSDRGFVATASADGAAEIELGQLALQKSGSAGVKQMAQQIIDDHTRANRELAGLAGRKQLMPATHPDPAAQATTRRLQALDGAAFDRAYADEMVKDHEKAVALFERTSAGDGDGDLRRFAADTLPALRHHLQMARALAGNGHGGMAPEERPAPRDMHDSGNAQPHGR